MKIAIFGLARSGLAAMKFLSKKSDVELYLVNSGEPKTWSGFSIIREYIPIERCFDQNDSLELFGSVDQIVLSPGIPRSHKTLELAHKNNVSIISEIELAFSASDIPVVAITGTNGKTTTATMVANVLEMAGKKVFLGGNIGRAYCEIFEENNYDIAVIEVSSFQLESIETFKPQLAMLLNITHNHGERYENISDYTKAKYNLFKNLEQSSYVLIGDELDSSSINAKIERIKDLEQFDFSKSKLVGDHNRKNFFCAYKALEFFDVLNRDQLMQQFINQFSGVDYRLQYLGDYQKLSFYNDAKSTNNAATRSALLAFQKSEHPLYLIIGGKLRSDHVDLNKEICDLKITKIFAIGEAALKLKEDLECTFDVHVFKGLSEVFEYLEEMKLFGNLLFSPAFPSFDQYKNFELRGAHFTDLFKQLSLY